MEIKLIAKADNLKLLFDSSKKQFVFTGGQYGEHSLYAQCYTDRVHAHWIGYMGNNGINYHCHPEYFPKSPE